ncbi:methylated-DNA--[protein]-cysteine S-methyltransferase [Rouxiella sp. Mn2063]|uniref:methylated-DNA--[protein]-cysteine S-methyltransferase n=1 Tax=Rouxiella sp. Mn2063 TaxID=3395262 RepID=UPI003BC38A38
MLKLISEIITTPLGELEIIADTQGNLRALEWLDYHARLLKLLAQHYGPDYSTEGAAKSNASSKAGFTLQQQAVPETLRQAIVNYFAGDLHSIDNIAVATAGTEFQRSVWAMLRTIPCGEVMSYGEMASRLGNPGAARAVGLADGSNPISIVVPCHRVIGSNGALTGYAGGVDRKRWLLQHEGYLQLLL